MIERAAVGPFRPLNPRTLAVIGLAAALVLAIVAGRAGAPYLFKRSTLQSEIATQVRATTGLTISTRHARFDLLPRPHVTMSDVHVSDPSGTVTMDAELLDGEVRLLPLLVGRIELAAASLQKPHLTVDLDGRPMPPDSTIGRAVRSVEMPQDAEQRLGSITLIDGTVSIAGRSRPDVPRFSHVDVTVDWRNLDSPASLTGSFRMNGTAADVAAWIAQPSKLIGGDHSAVVAQLHSAPLDFSAKGDVAGTNGFAFKGHVAATAPALAPVLASFASDTSLPAPFANATLDSDISIGQAKAMSVDFQNVTFRADGNEYEGAIAYQGGDRPMVTGTLATDQLFLVPFTVALPRLIDASNHWTRTALPSLRLGALELDLRFSAAHLRLPPFSIDDAALSVMTRGDRLEIGLNEGKAYGGALKGRVSLGSDIDGLNVRAAGTLTGADLAPLSWDALGWQLAGGTSSASANLETTGDSAAALASRVQGWIKAQAADGEISGIDLGRDLREATRAPVAKTPSLTGTGSTSFSRMLLNLQVANGVALIDETSMQGVSAGVALVGSVDLGARRIDLRAAVRSPKSNAADPTAAWRFDVEGPFDKLVAVPAPDGKERAP